jgi:hypothetical protein
MTMATLEKYDYVGVWPGSIFIYIIVPDRAKFDMIARPVTDHGEKENGTHVLTKSIGDSQAAETHGTLVFQHWIKSAESPAAALSTEAAA